MSNIKLTYDYTLNSIKVVSDDIDKTNTRLAVVLTLSGVLVNFGRDVPTYGASTDTSAIIAFLFIACYLLKLSAYALIIVAISISLWGLLPSSGGKIVLPEQLLEDEWNSIEEESYMKALIQFLEKETLLVLNDMREIKVSRLDWAIRAIALAVVMLGLDAMLAISIPILQKP